MEKCPILLEYSKMKLTQITARLTFTTLFFTAAVLAEVKTNKEMTPDKWDGASRQIPLNTEHNKVYKFSKSNQLRCWQDGKLIVWEDKLSPNDQSARRIFKKDSEYLYTYDYGETFCIYFGG